MPTSKQRVQGYLSDKAYGYLEKYKNEHQLKSISMALETLLEALAGQNDDSDLLADSYGKLKSELLSELRYILKSELLSELKSESVSELQSNLQSSLQDDSQSNLISSLQGDLLSNLQGDSESESVSESVSESESDSESDLDEDLIGREFMLKGLTDCWVVVDVSRDNKLYLWYQKSNRFSPGKGTIYNREDEAKNVVGRLFKRGNEDVMYCECVSYINKIGDEKKREETLRRLYKLVMN